MSNKATWIPFFAFQGFAFLVGARDAFTEFLLLDNVDPSFMLFTFFFVTTLVSLVFGVSRNEPKRIFRNLMNPKNLKIFVYLGLTTSAVFGASIVGIKLIGAPIFSLTEHAIIPALTAYVAYTAFSEKITRSHVAGTGICGIGVVLFMWQPESSAIQQFDWKLMLVFALAIIAAIVTTLSTAAQKMLVDLGCGFDAILVGRFLIPTLVMIPVVSIFGDLSNVSVETVGKTSLLGVLGFSLPLLLMCFGFSKSSLQRFSPYIILIPLYTIAVELLILEDKLYQSINSQNLAGASLLILGYIICEQSSFSNRKSINHG